MADAGRAMMLYRGMYDSTYTYEKLDVVNYNNTLYISTTDGNLGTEPTDVTKWKLFLQGGVSDNIQATDTYGLVGTKGDSSFVQLLLDSLASRVQGVALNRQTLGYSKKNLFKNTAVSSTSNGITFTVNDDGSVTANGTATAQARLLFKSNLVFDEDTILSIKGTTNGGVSGWYSGGNVFGSEKTVPAGTSYGGFFIFVNAGATVNNVTVYPMIRSAEIKDGTYEPYVDDVDTRLQKIDDSILNTLEEIDANTSEENIAGALAVKEISKKMQNEMEASSNWVDITDSCNFVFVNMIYGKVYKNSALRMVSFSIAVDGDVNNQGTIFVVGTLPSGCNPKILISSCDHTTDGVSVNLLTDGCAVKSSHSTAVSIANARYSGLIAF